MLLSTNGTTSTMFAFISTGTGLRSHPCSDEKSFSVTADQCDFTTNNCHNDTAMQIQMIPTTEIHLNVTVI